MDFEPKLVAVNVPREPQGAVLVLHGGASRRTTMRVSPTQLSVLRMIPIARRIARADRKRLAVFRLLNSVRGWGTDHTPVHDARWALEEMTGRLGGALPTCVVGHSLGGRAALLTTDCPDVRSAVALAPYVYPDDVPARVAAEHVLFVHGTDDRIASPARAEALARRFARVTDVRFVSVAGGKHAMLGHHAEFSGPAAEFARATLLDGVPAATAGTRP